MALEIKKDNNTQANVPTGARVTLKDGRKGKIQKHILDNIYRIRLDDGHRTVLERDEFEIDEQGNK